MKLGKRELWILQDCATNKWSVYPGYAAVMRQLRAKGLLEPVEPGLPDRWGTKPTQVGIEALRGYGYNV